MIFLFLQRLFFLLVVIKTLLLIKWAILRAFRRLPSPKDMVRRYGKDSWVAVTGATDGIGKGFCEVLASLKMNIILISRNIKKLNYVAQNLEGEFGIQTKVVQCDFADSLQNGFFERIMEEIEGFDISIWINNVGIAEFRKFHEFSKLEVQALFVVNVFP